MQACLSQRRTRLAAALPIEGAILLVGAGQPVPLPEGSDQTYPFRSHAEYYYLTAEECVGGVVAFDPCEANASAPDAGWMFFVPEVTEGERVWEGRQQRPGTPLSQFPDWLAARRGRPVAMLGAPLEGIAADARLTAAVREQFTHARRPKDACELAVLRRGALATAAGYAKLREHLRAGVTERALQIELEAGFFRHGGTRTGYGTIVGSGPNAAVLHFEPTDRAAREGEFVLVDAGAEVDRYVTDVTRTYVVGQPSAFQRDLYQIVLAAEQRAVSRCRPGVEWRELHLETAVQLTAGLVELGVMRGAPESLVEQEAHTLFFPHGLGHMVGLGVRDGSGLFPGRAKDPRPSLRTLRMDLPLARGYVVTVEPGLYFIPALLNDPVRRERFRDCVNWSVAEEHLALGGVRIEDNVAVTDGEPEILTAAIPKTL
ncbi:aminopeptidase P N-terminal domain-containing protein [Opitutus terrae]|uniref:Xaa-Pro aminopeptidase n=1 Tax=Opitutus terrae (strain DSM 11246 / JCM 15787 / PB90-1) TaxID=452637 RepID=B2A022_OPITP|nr:aminopeptidase P N-terminal domain-containing protein [Opitutus terrae]ACB77358.1 Xaa-Pro dipeptidase [Opitutus terrae PB90-1]